jgi:DNA-binding HxlR family transcriptional regulator
MPAKPTVYDEDYPSRRLVEIVGDKWTPIVIYILGQGTGRHGELQRRLPDISKKMLTQTLRRLERDGLLTRTVFAEVPPRVEYDLTPLGIAFLEPVTGLCAWATAHVKELNSVRRSRAKQAERSER